MFMIYIGVDIIILLMSFFACLGYQKKCLNLNPQARLVTEKYPGAIIKLKKNELNI